MDHDDPRVVAYLAGDLDGAGAEAFEGHLVDCDDCWRVVGADRRGRALAEGLRELAPPSLRDRVRMGVEAGSPRPPSSRHRRRTGAVLAALAVTLLTAGVMARLGGGGATGDPVTAVIAAATDPPSSGSVTVNGHRVALTRAVVDGRVVTVGRSAASFPMPIDARLLDNQAGSPWAAVRGSMTVVCLSRPENLLLVGDLPAERLVTWAHELPMQPGPG